MHLRGLALGYARTEVNKSPYLFSYMLTHGFPTPQASDKETESIFTIAATYSPRFPIIKYSGGAPTQKTTFCRQSLLSLFLKTSPRHSNAQSHPTLHHSDILNIELV